MVTCQQKWAVCVSSGEHLGALNKDTAKQPDRNDCNLHSNKCRPMLELEQPYYCVKARDCSSVAVSSVGGKQLVSSR